MAPARAHATHPDHEGERGIEVHVQPGTASFGTSDDRAFYAPGEVPVDGALQAINGAGLALRGSIGYRFTPWISAGFTLGLQGPPAAGQYTTIQAGLGAHDSFSSWQAGAYVRVYPMAFFNGAQENPRVFFTGLLDLRRLDPWVSVGVDFAAQISRTRLYTDPKTQVAWTTSYLGVPIGFGLEYRVIPPLAVGLALTLTPLLGGSTTKTDQEHVFRPGVDVVNTTTTTYTPAVDSNFEVFFGLSVRYTLTF